MFRITTNARTSWVGELLVENKAGSDKVPFESKTILFKVASNRDYTVNKVTNGVTTREKPSDFVFCRAHGSIAQAINDYCKEKKVGEEGKFVSRHLELAGHLETYIAKKTVPFEQIVALSGANYNLKLDHVVDVEQTVFVVKELNFLDASAKAKAPEVKTVDGVTLTPIDGAGVAGQSNFSNAQPTTTNTGGAVVLGAGCAVSEVQGGVQNSTQNVGSNIPLTTASDLTFTADPSDPKNCPF